LWHWLPSAAPALQRRARGSTFKQVTRDAIESLRVALPPLAEQRRLAAMLDKADAIRRKRREAIRLLEEFLRAAFLEMFGDPVKNPKGWEVVRLGEVGEVERGKFTPRPRNDPRYYGGPHPFIQTGDIAGVTGYLRCWKQTLNDEGVAVSRRFGAGTICISIAANIGDTAILTFDSYFPDSVVGITVDTGRARTEFVEYALRFLRPRLSASAPQTAQRNINLKVLRPLRIPVPPVSAQDRFGDLYRRTYGAATRVERGIAETDALFNSLAQQAFGGSQRPRPK
jgi:type I restriction enzyme S subunit